MNQIGCLVHNKGAIPGMSWHEYEWLSLSAQMVGLRSLSQCRIFTFPGDIALDRSYPALCNRYFLLPLFLPNSRVAKAKVFFLFLLEIPRP